MGAPYIADIGWSTSKDAVLDRRTQWTKECTGRLKGCGSNL